MKRGDVVLASLVPRSGSEQTGTRPVVIVSNDGFNSAPGWRSIVVVPCTTSSGQRGRGPTSVVLSKGAGGLPQESVAICHQVTTVDRSKLGQRYGTLTEIELAAVEEGLKAALDLE